MSWLFSGDKSEASHAAKSDTPAGYLCCALASFFAAWIFQLEWNHPTSHMSDVTFHLSILRALDAAVKSGGNPVDFWYDTSPFGFALFRGYQHFPHLILYGLYRLFFETFPLETILRVSTCCLAVFSPWAFFIGARLLRLSVLAAGLTGLFSVVLVEVGNYGLGLHNYAWGSGGIIAQLWAVCFLVPAIGMAVRFLKNGTGLALSVLLGFCSFGSHVVAIIILAVAIGLYAATSLISTIISSDGEKAVEVTAVCRRTLIYFGSLLLVTTHQWLFTFLDAPYLRGSIHEPRWKFESYGAAWVLENFANGNLFDVGRFPGITALLLLGLVFCLFLSARLTVFANGTSNFTCASTSRWLVVGFVFSLVLFFGWQTWGWTLNFFGLLRSLHWHRLVIGVHIFGLLLAGIGGASLITATRYRFIAWIILAGISFPLFQERISYYVTAKSWLSEALEAQKVDEDVSKLVAKVHELPRGRVFAGFKSTWSNQLKVGKNLELDNVLLGEGIPAEGVLYYPMSLAGDVVFDVAMDNLAQRRGVGMRYVIVPTSQSVPAGLTKIVRYGKYGLYTDSETTTLEVVSVGFKVKGDSKNFPAFMRSWFKSPLLKQKIYGVIPNGPEDSDWGQSIDAGSAALPIFPNSPGAGIVLSESSDSPSKVTGTVQLDKPGYVLAKIPYHPNWEARIDNAVVAPLWVTPGFMAVPCSGGTHQVDFAYHGSKLKLLLFLGGLCSCLGMLRIKRLSQL